MVADLESHPQHGFDRVVYREPNRSYVCAREEDRDRRIRKAFTYRLTNHSQLWAVYGLG